ncbi:MAG TPA: hypothetical protein VFG69_00120, partial [Nannocystaceae bacterium]|nr:hypothetical protein [Nannocystaceae bacterium]
MTIRWLASILPVLAVPLVSDAAPAAQPAPTEAAAKPPANETLSPELQALEAELVRGLAGLRLPGTPEPYRAEVRLVRAELLSLDGSYGGVITNVLDRQAAGAVEVRVGSVARDNTNYFGGDSGIEQLEVALEPSPG